MFYRNVDDNATSSKILKKATQGPQHSTKHWSRPKREVSNNYLSLTRFLP